MVYGYPAIALPISLGVRVCLEEIEGSFSYPNLDDRLSDIWKNLFPPTGLRLSLHSDLPIGCGLGSSAAISIATLRAYAAWKKIEPNFSWLFEKGFEMERVFHGNPSGLDHAVSARNQGISYQKNGPVFDPITLPSLNLVVIHSHEPKQTKKMVLGVRERWPDNRSILEEIGTCTQKILQATWSIRELGMLLTKNHLLLKELGVSTAKLDHLVDMALENGAYGDKLTGAGGGGIIFALVENCESFLRTINNLGYEGFALQTGISS